MDRKIYRKPEVRTNVVRLGLYGDYGAEPDGPSTAPFSPLTTGIDN